MKFPYIKIPTSDPVKPWKPLPLIPIRVFDETGDSSLEILALLDSGADKSLFNAEIAKVLKIDLSTASEENFTGIEGGVLKAKVKTIHLQMVRDTEIFEVPIGFIENVGFSAILGQEGFFDKFSITFNREKLEIEIKKV